MLLLGLEYFALTVVSAVTADAMRKLDLAALRANGTSRSSDHIIGATAGMGTSTTGLTLRHCHGSISYPPTTTVGTV